MIELSPPQEEGCTLKIPEVAVHSLLTQSYARLPKDQESDAVSASLDSWLAGI
jgi:hypothetical protein